MQRVKITTRLVSMFCAIAILVCAMPSTVHAETLAERIERLKKEIAAIGDQIDNLDENIAGQEAAKAQYANQRATIQELLAANEEDIRLTEGAIEQKQGEIAEKRQVIYDNEELLKERMVATYKMNNSTVLSTMLNVNSLSELLTVSKNLQTVLQHDTDLLNMLQKQREDLEAEKAELDVLIEDLQRKNDEFQSTIATLSGNIAAADASISKAEADKQAQEEALGESQEALEKAQREMAAVQAALKNQGSTSTDGSKYEGGALAWPVPGFYNVSCEYGSPDPNGTPHRGMDIAGSGISGAPIVAGADGTVIVAVNGHYSYGNYVVVDHGGGLKTLYAHASSLAVGVGTTVSRGQTIAYVGSTGFSTGYHLHLEVHQDGALQNPRAYLSA